MNRALLIAWLAVVSVVSTEALQADVIHREKSLYRIIEVTETNERRCLIFAVRQTNHNQSCIDLADPKKIVFPYVRMTLAGLLVQPEIERALIVGLGGTVPSPYLNSIPTRSSTAWKSIQPWFESRRSTSDSSLPKN